MAKSNSKGKKDNVMKGEKKPKRRWIVTNASIADTTYYHACCAHQGSFCAPSPSAKRGREKKGKRKPMRVGWWVIKKKRKKEREKNPGRQDIVVSYSRKLFVKKKTPSRGT